MKYRVAIGTNDGKNITEHFGTCGRFQILEIYQERDEVVFIEDRITAHQEECRSHLDDNIIEKIKALNDCQIILVKQIGGKSEKLLIHYGFIPLMNSGSIDKAMFKIIKFYKNQIFNREE